MIHNKNMYSFKKIIKGTLRLEIGFKVSLILLSTLCAVLIALHTRDNSHPDEYRHVDTFSYYENHWWPPDIDYDEVAYGKFGWSRVYTGEIVYLIYGRIGRLILPIFGTRFNTFVFYRMINVGLFFLTVTLLLFFYSHIFDPKVIGLVLLCFPQFIYIYSYANSDAWAISLEIFIFLIVLKMLSEPCDSWSWVLVALLGCATGLIIVSKLPYLISLCIPYCLLAMKIILEYYHNNILILKKLFLMCVLTMIIAFVIAAPMKIIYPHTQGNFADRVETMTEKRALDGHKPSDATNPYYRMASKGETMIGMLKKYYWIHLTVKSFYAMFGWMEVRLSSWIYRSVGIAVIFSFCLTCLSVCKLWKKLSVNVRTCLLLSPLLFSINAFASMHHSLHADYQPQGRYLFPSLLCVVFMLAGTSQVESKKLQRLRLVIFLIFFPLCLYCLNNFIIFNPHFR